MKEFSSRPRELIGSFWRNRALILAMVRRDVLGRYRGAVLGIVWPFIVPLLMLAVYTFVFTVIFKARWPVQGDSKAEFALVLFSGLMVFNMFAECLTRAPRLILSNVNYVKKVVFPLEILIWVSLGAALFHWAVSALVWVAAYVVFIGAPHPSIIWLPLVILPLVLLTAGVSWALASLGVYLRDIGQFIGILTTMFLFLSPIFYPLTSIPEKYRILLYLNPLTLIIENVRNVMFWGRAPDLLPMLLYSVLACLFSWLCFAWFQKTRRGFADVI